MIHYSANGTLAVVHGLLPVGRRMVTARLVLVEARQALVDESSVSAGPRRLARVCTRL